MLVPVEKYLSSGVHIGAIFKTGFMREYIFKTRQDKLNVMDIQKIDYKLRVAGNFLSQFEPEEILLVARRKYAQKSVQKFSEVTGAQAMVGRFVPGTLTNPQGRIFLEPSVVMVSDPVADREAIAEASSVGIPVVAICNTNNTISNIDLVIPANNRGKRSFALVYWILAREYLLNRGLLQKREDFDVSLEDFER